LIPDINMLSLYSLKLPDDEVAHQNRLVLVLHQNIFYLYAKSLVYEITGNETIIQLNPIIF
jgi:hypothetical protein